MYAAGAFTGKQLEAFQAEGFSKAPWLVDLTEDRDLWRWALPNSREINAALRSYPMDFQVWCDLAARKSSDLVPEGAAILRYQQSVVDSHVRDAREIDLDGHKVLAVNATTMISEIGNDLAVGRPFSVCWFQRTDGMYQYSLRSTDGGLDVSEIARQHKGGGHIRAAGYEGVHAPF